MKQWKRKVIRVINQLFIVILNRIFILFRPLKQNRALFISDSRETLGGNLKFMYDYIENKDYERVVILKKDVRLKRSLKDKINMIKYLSTAKYIFLEDIVQATSHLKIRKGQELVQLWHGPGAYKKFGHSRESTDLKRIHKGYKKYTKAIVSSKAIRPCYAEAYAIDVEKVQATGFPRTDIFFDKTYKEQKRKELYEKYPFMQNKKVILFAPTYRGTTLQNAKYDIKKLDLKKIYETLKEDYIFIFKWHPFLQNNITLTKNNSYSEYKKYPDFYYNMSEERDINDLLLVTDILITDYSSVIFDYVFVEKPIIYFTYDIESYVQNGRGLYFPFEEYVYGEVAKTSDELLEAIQKGKMEEEKRKVFKEKFVGACNRRVY